ncbi:cytochrome P450 302a1, mitochondrial-like isoform X2 [Centruroides sculpturatus]|uniref:cytochrome P450 302a1, mitochondrial-like isoform X2 n=1 Tax=Centruroides sculpturatus TaxID=218467 RepID=UPI000C6DF877|nr:cytochrome P450 302a1, mitochondrial-like isoform X2 [Centruroides sculpturatus]
MIKMKRILPSAIHRHLYRSRVSTATDSFEASTNELPSFTIEEEHSRIKEFSEIPGPKPLPVIGNIWRYLPVIGEYDPNRQHINYEKMYREYGSIVKEVVIGKRIVVHLFDPNDMETLYRNEGRYPSRLSHRALLKYRKERPHLYNNGGLFPSNNEEWHRLRQAFQRSLLHSSIINEYISPLQELSEDVIGKIKKIRNSQNQVDDFQKDLYKWAIECTGIITLNRRLGCIEKGLCTEEEINNLVKSAGDTHQAVMITENGLPLWQLFPTAAYRSLVHAQDVMTKILKRFLEKSKNETECKSAILNRFMSMPNIDEKDIFAMILDMFLAGIDTTAYSAAFTLYHLARNQECQKILQKELKSKLPSKTSEISAETLKSLPYLKACIKESMRLNPIAIGTGRILPKDLIVSNYRLPAKTMVIAHHQVACRQFQNFPDALSFRPERWLRNDFRNTIHPFLVLPFGYGPRMCIGRRFAELELYILVSKIFRHFNLEYHWEDIDCFTRLINVPDKQLRLKFIDTD